jgi:hypothetical protein
LRSIGLRRDEAPVTSAQGRSACPFNTEAYAAGLVHLGVPEMHPARGFPILRRPIAATGLHDGVGPWPYLWIEDRADLAALYEDFRHLVTLTVVTQPGYVPKARGDDAILLKQHFVYDPGLPSPVLSRRTLARLRRSEAIGTFAIVRDAAERMVMADLYEGLKLRRQLTGSFFDKGARHFQAIAGLESSIFFRVSGPAGVGAMACGVLFGGMLQILHMVTSEDGLRWNASYLLMQGLQAFARDRGVRMLTGGMPASGRDGLRIFKERWANAFEPVYLLRIVNDPARYAALCAAMPSDGGFFPAYRRP